jgi:DNA-binding response OmpR family regulator
MPRRVRVLVVDDNPDQVKSVLLLLETEGYETRGVYNAQSILSEVLEFDPDVVIMDIKMPERSGWEAASELRRRVTNLRLLLIAVTGHYTRGVDKVLSEMSGFDHVLTKPVDPATLLGLIAKHTSQVA